MKDYEIKELKSQINDIVIKNYGIDNKSQTLAWEITKLVMDIINRERVMRK